MKLFPVSVLLFAVISCTYHAGNTSSEIPKSDKASEITKSIISENSIIDLPFWKILIQKGNQAVSVEELAQAKAALYRFYQHVKVQDNYYTCDLYSASDINVSEEIFNDLMNNLKEINAFVKEIREEGKEIVLPEFTEDYLNSLLN